MRVTQFMMSDAYTRRLGNAMERLSIKSKRVDTGRKLFKGSDNPEAAAKAYMYRRDYQNAEDHLNNTKDMQSLLETREDSMMQVKNELDGALSSMMTILNGDKNTKEMKMIVAKEFRAMQKSMVMSMNSKYGEKFMFGGSSVSEPPFKLSEDQNTLEYRGVDVSQGNNQELKDLAGEKIYVDLGFGLAFENTGELLDSSGFNVSAPGINILGYGTDDDGIEKNPILLLGQIATALENNVDQEELSKYINPLKDAPQKILNSITKLGSESKFLEKTKFRIENIQMNLQQKISDVEHIDAEKAIMDLNKATFMYQAMLKSSSHILSQSLIDFMR